MNSHSKIEINKIIYFLKNTDYMQAAKSIPLARVAVDLCPEGAAAVAFRLQRHTDDKNCWGKGFINLPGGILQELKIQVLKKRRVSIQDLDSIAKLKF